MRPFLFDESKKKVLYDNNKQSIIQQKDKDKIMIKQYTKLKKITLFELLKKIKKNDFSLVNELTLPSREKQNEILENILLGIPFTIKGAANQKGNILISSIELNTLLFFFNCNIKLKVFLFYRRYAIGY